MWLDFGKLKLHITIFLFTFYFIFINNQKEYIVQANAMIIQSTLRYYVLLWHGRVFIQRCHFRCFVSLMVSICVTICNTNHLLWILHIKSFTGLLSCLIIISVLWEHQFMSPCNHSQYPIPTDYNTNSVLRREFIFQPQQ